MALLFYQMEWKMESQFLKDDFISAVRYSYKGLFTYYVSQERGGGCDVNVM